MFNLPEKIIIFDTEYTAWEGSLARKWSGPGEYREIVEIGAIGVDTLNLSKEENFSLLVKPKKNPKLSSYFISLTGITQEELDKKGIDFPEALTKFHKWVSRRPCFSFGHDGLVLEENVKLLGISFPFSKSDFSDIREVFKSHGIDTANYMSSTITEAFGKKSPFRGHRALGDARTILEGLRELVKMGNPEKFDIK